MKSVRFRPEDTTPSWICNISAQRAYLSTAVSASNRWRSHIPHAAQRRAECRYRRVGARRHARAENDRLFTHFAGNPWFSVSGVSQEAHLRGKRRHLPGQHRHRASFTPGSACGGRKPAPPISNQPATPCPCSPASSTWCRKNRRMGEHHATGDVGLPVHTGPAINKFGRAKQRRARRPRGAGEQQHRRAAPPPAATSISLSAARRPSQEVR